MVSVLAAFWQLAIASDRPELLTRAVTIQDMVTEAVVGDPGSLEYDYGQRQITAFSPDGERAVVVLQKADLTDRTVKGSILLFSTRRLLDLPHFQTIAEFKSVTNHPPIALVRWVGNDTLMFGATDGREPPQIYALDLNSYAVRKLTGERQAIRWYELSEATNQLIVFAELPPADRPLNSRDCLMRGCRMSARSLVEALDGRDLYEYTYAGVGAIYDLSAGTRVELPTPSSQNRAIHWCHGRFVGGISPDGLRGIQICRLRIAPAHWSFYQRVKWASGDYIEQAFIIDLKTGGSRPLVDAPWLSSVRQDGPIPTPLWIDKGRTVLLPMTLIPSELTENREGEGPQWGALAIDAHTAAVTVIAILNPLRGSVIDARWDPVQQMLRLHGRGVGNHTFEAVAIKRFGDQWIPLHDANRIESPAVRRKAQIFLKQSLNEHPVLVAQLKRSAQHIVVLDPNPSFRNLRRGYVQETEWDVRGGERWKGLIYLPPHYRKGKRYPIVLQTHGIKPSEFSLTGYVRNFAAQPLASKGIVVLQVQEEVLENGVFNTPREWDVVRRGYEKAIDHLSALGIVDRTRVGIVGWSRTGSWVNHTLTHSEYPFAASVLMDAADRGLWSYVTGDYKSTLVRDFGAKPYGTGLAQWLNTSPGFHLERIRTPMLMWQALPPLGLWDWYVGLRDLEKPVEYWVLPDGEHELVQVDQRVLMNQLTVDWFDFWLNKSEDPDPAKASQYQRWRELKWQQEQVESKPRPPLLNWVATEAKDSDFVGGRTVDSYCAECVSP